MKGICKQMLGVLSLALFFNFGLPTQKASAQDDNSYVSYNDFYQDLAPYGQWIQDPKYGYVWSPNDNSGSFRPYYTNGHWAMTQYGNTWVSDYPWGWACFHYGRWVYDAYYGWLWIPGSDWGPAWVSWRCSDNEYGWAPLSPDYTDFNSDYYCPNNWWVFLQPQYVYSGNYYRYWNGPHGNKTILKGTHFNNHTYENNHITYISGPSGSETQGITQQPVQVFHLSNSPNLTARVHNSEVKMYRPAQVSPGGGAGGEKIAPPNVVSAPRPVISAPQAISGAPGAPQFRNDIPKNAGQRATVGTNFNETAKPSPVQQHNSNPYEYDVNRPVEQPSPSRQESAPAPRPEPQQARQVQQSRPQQVSMPAQQARQAPVAPQPARSAAGGAGGGRR